MVKITDDKIFLHSFAALILKSLLVLIVYIYIDIRFSHLPARRAQRVSFTENLGCDDKKVLRAPLECLTSTKKCTHSHERTSPQFLTGSLSILSPPQIKPEERHRHRNFATRGSRIEDQFFEYPK